MWLLNASSRTAYFGRMFRSNWIAKWKHMIFLHSTCLDGWESSMDVKLQNESLRTKNWWWPNTNMNIVVLTSVVLCCFIVKQVKSFNLHSQLLEIFVISVPTQCVKFQKPLILEIELFTIINLSSFLHVHANMQIQSEWWNL